MEGPVGYWCSDCGEWYCVDEEQHVPEGQENECYSCILELSPSAPRLPLRLRSFNR